MAAAAAASPSAPSSIMTQPSTPPAVLYKKAADEMDLLLQQAL
eukprot:SAG22_NODE_15335_length_351_cov_0.813492_1_plen_42_part_01